MTEFVYVKPRSATGLLALGDTERVAESLRRGSPAVLPTETGYMLAALATSEDAVKRAFEVKDRPTSAVMHVACASLRMAAAVGVLTERATALLGRFTPGPLSVIVSQTGLLPDGLVTVNGTVGIRVPDHPATLQVITAVGAPLTATSLNSSGSRLPSVDEPALRTLNWPGDDPVYVVRDDASIAYDSASTLVRLTGESIEILRPGPVSESEINTATGGTHAT
ncbi:MAG: threonylcarbamoyl-AMP synthase [Nocardiopsaceae bacterium]|nr:threonylcarbamoyl-AMP synthase [Nocardiopsaceae bacterium]